MEGLGGRLSFEAETTDEQGVSSIKRTSFHESSQRRNISDRCFLSHAVQICCCCVDIPIENDEEEGLLRL